MALNPTPGWDTNMTLKVMATAALSLAAMGALRSAAQESPSSVHYELSAAFAPGDTLPRVTVRLRFPGEADGTTTLALPDAWGGEEELWRCLTDLRVEGQDARLEPGADPAHRVIHHAPGARIDVSYQVVQDWTGVPQADGRNQYRPTVQPEYLHLIGDAIFARPEWNGDTPATFTRGAIPPGWSFASDLEHGAGGRPLTLGDVRESVLVAGDFRIVARGSEGRQLRVALRGRWSFTDDAFVDRLDRIVRSHRAFWGDGEEPFLVTVLPLAAEPGSSMLGGTGRSDAFAFFATDNAQEFTLNRVLAHEHLHTWIPRRIGRMPEQYEARDYWLSEGFTDFYTFRLLIRDGIWSLTDYEEAVNEALSRYAQSPVRAVPNATIVSDFWKGREIGDLPYQRGFLLALLWDDRLRRASGGKQDLDDVILALHREWRDRPQGAEPPLASDALRAGLRSAGLDPAADLERFIEQGQPILLPEDLLGADGRIATEELPEFSRGFDPQATSAAGGIVSGVDPDGPAHAAGLRDGMKIVKREAGQSGNPTLELVYLVQDGDTERRIRYLPHGKRRFLTQRIIMPPAGDTAGRERLVQRLGGM